MGEPNPGSDEARARGCACPVIDNGHGRGSGRLDDDGKPLFWVMHGCPLHDEVAEHSEVPHG